MTMTSKSSFMVPRGPRVTLAVWLKIVDIAVPNNLSRVTATSCKS
jgi:hypothetical protein